MAGSWKRQFLRAIRVVAGTAMRKRFVILSGTSIVERREEANSATEAMELVLHHMSLRRPGVAIEDERGNPIMFFQLEEEAAAEVRNEREREARAARSRRRGLGGLWRRYSPRLARVRP